jgi:predicted nucleic acid-binding Zn finger protein
MNDIWLKLRGRHELDSEMRREVEEVFGRKGISALDAIDAGRVKKYLDFFVVEGRTAAYIVEDDFCTCGDFLYRGRNCWHLLAVRIAQETGLFESVNDWYQDTLKEKPKKSVQKDTMEKK